MVEIERGKLTLSMEGSAAENIVLDKPGQYSVRVFAPYISFDEFFSADRKLIGLEDLRSSSEWRMADDGRESGVRILATIKTGTCTGQEEQQSLRGMVRSEQACWQDTFSQVTSPSWGNRRRRVRSPEHLTCPEQHPQGTRTPAAGPTERS